MARASSKASGFRGRLDMRLSTDQEVLLRAASALVGESMTAFVLGAATERANELLDRANRIEITRPAFDRFMTTLYRPTAERGPSEMPKLRFYAASAQRIPGTDAASAPARPTASGGAVSPDGMSG